MPNPSAFGYAGASVRNPYSYSQVAVTWDELFSQANVAFAGGTLVPTPTYFNNWRLALIRSPPPPVNYVISGPSLFNWGQVVLANPATGSAIIGVGTVCTGTVFNPNFGKLSVLYRSSLCYLRDDFVPTGVVPI